MSGVASNPNEKKREKLPEEVAFNKRVYGGISYFGQAISGIFLTHWLQYGSGKEKYGDPAAEWFGSKILSKITSQSKHAAIESTKPWITVTAMVIVGTLFLIPVKMLENAKASIVEKWVKQNNKKREDCGAPLTEQEKQHQENLLQELRDEPKMTWKSLFSGRAFALSAVYTVLPILNHFNLNKKSEDYLTEAAQKSLNNLGDFKMGKTAEQYFRISLYDAFYSVISAGGLYVFSHFVNPYFTKNTHEQNEKKCEQFVAEAKQHAIEIEHAHPELSSLTAITCNHQGLDHTAFAEQDNEKSGFLAKLAQERQNTESHESLSCC